MSNSIIHFCYILLFFLSLIPGQNIPTSASGSKPSQATILENKNIRITFNQIDGLPDQYELLQVNDRFIGKDKNSKIEAVVRHLADHSERKVEASLNAVTTFPGKADFKYKLTFDNVQAGTFEINYTYPVFLLIFMMTNSCGSSRDRWGGIR